MDQAERANNSSKPATPLGGSEQDSPAAPSAEAVSPTPANEESALALLQQRQLPAVELEAIGRNAELMQSRKVRLAVLRHPNTPRYLSLPGLRHAFTFDLVQIALDPSVASDIRVAAEKALIQRLDKLVVGERLALARRASGAVAGELLRDPDARVVRLALQNSRLVEVAVVRALMQASASAALVEAVCRSNRWRQQADVQVALLRSNKTPLAFALGIARALPVRLVREALQDSPLPASIRACLEQALEQRSDAHESGASAG